MKVVIVEDEIAASENLAYLLNSIDPEIEVIKVLDSVKSAIAYFTEAYGASLIFMDIHLADGIAFEIFKQIDIKTPIIFTTAYDQYAIQAFKVNSIDYILKPISKEELSEAIDKFKTSYKTTKKATNDIDSLLEMLQTKTTNYKSTYLVQKRDELLPIKITDIAYFYIDIGIVKATTFDNQTYIINKKLEDIELELNPSNFHRVNRQFILNREAIVNMKFYFNSKLIININPPYEDRIIVSKAKSNEVKNWINS
ncbi:hypothetical protein A9Q86_10775 [Flavobacteriales bacterium 33_180_T64]|nr:hypothetical protein A9Q86_10775 [Flavobacteriales bacterium 33_180_T64]